MPNRRVEVATPRLVRYPATQRSAIAGGPGHRESASSNSSALLRLRLVRHALLDPLIEQALRRHAVIVGEDTQFFCERLLDGKDVFT